MSINIKSGHSILELNTNSDNSLKVNLPMTLSGTGYVVSSGEVDAGTYTGTRIVRPMDVSQDYRLRTGIDKILWQDTFDYNVINTSKYKLTSFNQNIVLSGNSLNLNCDKSINNNDFCCFQTFKTFSLIENAPTYLNFNLKFDSTFKNDNIIEFGLGLVSSASTPTDGIFFRTSGTSLACVVSYSGIETTAITSFIPSLNTNNDYLLAITDSNVEFWVDDNIICKIIPNNTLIISSSTTLTLKTADNVTSSSNSLPLFIRNKNVNNLISSVKTSVNSIDVLFGDIKTNKDYKTMMVTNGQSSINTPDGQPFNISGNTSANLLNSTPPINVNILSNTTAGYTTLGGDFSIAASASSETDYIVFSYFNPSGNTSTPSKTLNITGVKIDTFNTEANIGATGSTLQWSIGVGATSMSLLVEDSEILGTRAARRLGLGVQYFPSSSTFGTVAIPNINSEFNLIVEAGSYCHIILKTPISLSTSNLFYRGNIIINGYWD